MISYTEDPDAPEWKGYLYAVLFFVSSVLASFFFHQLFHIGMTAGMHLKASLIAAIYQKVALLNEQALITRNDTCTCIFIRLAVTCNEQRSSKVVYSGRDCQPDVCGRTAHAGLVRLLVDVLVLPPADRHRDVPALAAAWRVRVGRSWVDVASDSDQWSDWDDAEEVADCADAAER